MPDTAFSPEVLHAATERLELRRAQHEAAFVRRREEIYRRLPRTQELDRLLRANVTRAAVTALRSGGDAKAAIRAIQGQCKALREERASLLDSLGYPADALDEKPLCERCHDRGWHGTSMCTCLRALCQEEQVKNRTSLMNFRGQSFAQFRLDCYPTPFRPKMNNIYRFCREYAQKFPAQNRRNLLFSGAPGLGKTFLSVCIAREVTEKGYSVVYDSAVRVFDRLDRAKFAGDEAALQEKERYTACDLLILDDLGSEMTSPSVQSALYYLVNDRLLEERHTIISTNLSRAELEERYSAQVCSRLIGEYAWFLFSGEDLRRTKKPVHFNG